MLSLLFFLAAAGGSILAGQTEHWSVGNIIITDPTIRFRLDLYSPTTPGVYPVIIYLPGLSGFVPSTFYNTLVTSIASQDVILIGISKIENIKPEKIAVNLADFLQWIITSKGALRLFAEHKAVKGVIPDVSNRLGFLSHSSAAHPIGQYLNTTCGPLKLLAMMNPVDGLDPFGIVRDFVTHPPTPLPFRIPTLIISSGLDNVPATRLTPPCAPNNISNDRWYRSLYGPTFLVNFTDYGHADNLDGAPHEASKLMCKACEGSACQLDVYKQDEATMITTFVNGIFQRDVKLINVIRDPQPSFKSRVTNKFDLHGYDYRNGGPGGFCTHD